MDISDLKHGDDECKKLEFLKVSFNAKKGGIIDLIVQEAVNFKE